jgi:hypothetical protein
VLSALDDPCEDLPGPVGPVVGDDGVQRLEPLARLDRLDIPVPFVSQGHRCSSKGSCPRSPIRKLARRLLEALDLDQAAGPAGILGDEPGQPRGGLELVEEPAREPTV